MTKKQKNVIQAKEVKILLFHDRGNIFEFLEKQKFEQTDLKFLEIPKIGEKNLKFWKSKNFKIQNCLPGGQNFCSKVLTIWIRGKTFAPNVWKCLPQLFA